MSDDIDAIIAAIEDDNPGTEIEVIDRGAYVRIQAEQRMKVTRASIERHIGRAFEMRQLEPMMSALRVALKLPRTLFCGRISERRNSPDEPDTSTQIAHLE
jgi:hypothetical protein